AHVGGTLEITSADVALRWDHDAIYVAVHVVDPDVTGADTIDPYKNDCVELYVTGESAPSGDYDGSSHQLIVDWKGLAVDYGPAHTGNPPANNPAHFTAQTKKAPDGWNLEAAIGWQLFSTAALAEGQQLGLDLEANDGDGTNILGSM